MFNCIFCLFSKSVRSFLFVWSVHSSIQKCTPERALVPLAVKFEKSNKKWEICLVPIILQEKILAWTLLPIT